jgi:hypothetical protein
MYALEAPKEQALATSGVSMKETSKTARTTQTSRMKNLINRKSKWLSSSKGDKEQQQNLS